MAHILTYVCDFADCGPQLSDKPRPCRTLADGACALCNKHGCARHLSYSVVIGIRIGPSILEIPPLGEDVAYAFGSITEPVEFVGAVENFVCSLCKSNASKVCTGGYPTKPLAQAAEAELDHIRAKIAEHALKTQ